jgi:hypothetical protein
MTKCALLFCITLLVAGCSSGSDSQVGHRTLDDGRSVSIWKDGANGKTYYVDGDGKHYIR